MSNMENRSVTRLTLYADAPTHNNRPPYIYAKQYDTNSRILIIKIMSSNKEVMVTGTAQLNATKPDGTHIFIAGTVNDDGTVTVGLTAGLLSTEGKVACDITVFGQDGDDQTVLTTSTFYIMVDESNYDQDAGDGTGGVITPGASGAGTALTAENIIAALGYTPADEDDVTEIATRVAALEYVPIEIKSFNNTVKTAEIGSTVNGIYFTWSLSKTPTSLTINGKSIDVASTSYGLTSANITATEPGTIVAGRLVATDEKKSVTRSTAITFTNGVYYGAAANGTVDSDFINSLTKSLRTGKDKAMTFTVTANSGQYIWYALPKSYGTCNFNVGGFDGGFTLNSTVSFTNASGYTEDYYVYRSDNANLGTQTVKVS